MIMLLFLNNKNRKEYESLLKFTEENIEILHSLQIDRV